MSQGWTITDTQTGNVLCPWFETASFGVHPKDRGWAWDADTQKATRVDAPPTLLQRWEGAAWVADLDACRAQAWAAVKAARDAAEWAGCQTTLGRVDTDPDSQRKVAGAALAAVIAQAAGQPFAVDWTMQDNQTIAHDGPATIAMGIVVGDHVAACHAVARAKRAEIAAASDEAAISAVDVSTGWPS